MKDSHEFDDLSRRVIGAAIVVHKGVGHGFREKTYENALIVEFARLGIDCSQQLRFPIYYCGVQIDEFVPDLVVAGELIVDAKTIDRIGEREIGQMMNYLRVTGLKTALLLNFKHPRLEIRRVVL